MVRLLLLLALTAVPAALRAPAPLPFYYDLYTFRGEGGRTSVVAAFAVSAGELQREDSRQGPRYRFDVTLVLADTARRAVVRRDDSVFVVMPRALSSDHLLFTQLEVQAPPSRSTVQRVIMTDATRPGVGQLQASPFVVPDYTGTRLMLSDIALGQPDARAGWRRGDLTLALLPTNLFPSSAFEVFYEIYNLPDRDAYTTEILVERADTADRRSDDLPPVRLRFADEARARPDGAVPEQRRVETSLGQGRYRITVTVMHPQSRQSATRSRVFHVRGWERGTTLVPALPRKGG